MKIINVNDAEILLDDEDYSYINQCYNLKIDNNGYVYCSSKKKYRKMGLYSVSLHKILMNPDTSGRNIVVDHKDGNKLNNKKDNLRICTQAQNAKNRKPEGGTSQYKGIYWGVKDNGWKCKLNNDGKYIGLGCFTNEIAAANCYNHWANVYHGEFALLNECPYMSEEEWESFRKKKIKTSKYFGVCLTEGKWLVQIRHDGKTVRVGWFNNEIEAALVYNAKAFELKGDKAKLNDV
jgi:hypothetical protein